MSDENILPNEIVHIQEFLCGLVRMSNNKEHLSAILVTILRIPQETMEQSQIHVMMLEYDKRFEKIAKQQTEFRKELKIIKWAVAAIAAGAPAVQIFLKIIGLG